MKLKIITALYTLSIYASLPLVRGLTESLREKNLLRVSIALATIVALLGVFLFLFKRLHMNSVKATIITLILGILIASLSRLAESPEEAVHFLQYGLLGAFLYGCFDRFPRKWQYAYAALTGLVLGALDEVIQYFIPSRYFDWRDIGFNALGIFLGLLVCFGVEVSGRIGRLIDSIKRSPSDDESST